LVWPLLLGYHCRELRRPPQDMGADPDVNGFFGGAVVTW
jgi:hypothetical protein